MERIGCLQIFGAGVLWGSIGLFIRFMEEAGAGAGWISFLRVAFAGGIMLLLVLFRKGTVSLRVSGRELLLCAMLGLICHGIYNIFYSIAVVRAGVALSAVLLNIAPLFTALFSALLFKERISWGKALALCINVIGCSLAVTGGKLDPASISVLGLACGLGAGLCYAMTAIIGRFAGETTDTFVISTYSYLFAAAFLLLWIWLRGTRCLFTAPVMGWGILYALIPTALGYVLYYQGLQKMTEISKVPVIASVECVVAILWGVLLFRESMGMGNYLGVALIFCSLVLMNRKKTPASSG